MSRIHEALKRAEREKAKAAPAEELPAAGSAPARPSEHATASTPAPVARPDAAPSRRQEKPAGASKPAPAPAVATPDTDPQSTQARTNVAPQNAAAPSAIASSAAPAPAPIAIALAAAAAASESVSAPHASRMPSLPALLANCRRPPWHEDASKLFFLSGTGHSFATEQLRTLRSRLYQFRESRPLKSVLVTSAMPGEGKTFICANLAYAFARQMDRRILLIDADLRSPAVHSLLGAPADPGLASFLRGEAGFEQILQRGPHENLYLIAAGKPAQNPADLIAGGRLKTLLAQAAPLFDWILLDSPAAAPVSDALQIAAACDGALLVVQSGKTPYDLAQSVTRELRQRHLLGVVLNRTEPAAAHS